ncbi:regulator of hemoglobinization and erythroid cell expansion protein [Trichosurus vulpecula]|uniref:regulator of hemoglobinization and erythroid cell expansion protein n=1 Tax=Trichosurus vulpecula TaxID=9337 RepID=UPI00186B575F|nr:regulator of hemoglobinization and erythroid cell expansion protein [Trichosurus vulpecula]
MALLLLMLVAGDNNTTISPVANGDISFQQAELSLWHIILTEVIAFLLQAVLLLILYILLRRQIANYYGQMVKVASAQAQAQAQAQAPKKPEGNCDPPALEKRKSKRNVPGPALACRDDSDSDSDSSSDSSDSSESYPPASISEAPKDMNYSTLVFPPTVSQKLLSPADYENIKAAGDYVNVNPKNCTNNAWNFNCSFSSEPVEYTEVAM